MNVILSVENGEVFKSRTFHQKCFCGEGLLIFIAYFVVVVTLITGIRELYYFALFVGVLFRFLFRLFFSLGSSGASSRRTIRSEGLLFCAAGNSTACCSTIVEFFAWITCLLFF